MWNNFSQSATEDESISNAFCTNGIFKIWGDELVYRYPQVSASVQNKKMVIAVDKSVVLLEDENVAKCSFLGFNSQIDAIAISHSGNLIICGLSDGEIHGIYIKGIPLFNLCINQDDIQKNKTIVGIQQVEKNYFITCTNGSVYKLSDVDESRVDSCLNISLKENDTVPFDETIMDNVKIIRVTNTKILNEITSALIIPFPTNNELLFLMGTKCFLRFQENTEDTKVIISDFFQGIKFIFSLDNYTLILTNSGHLLEVCQHTKLIYQNSFNVNYLIDDMTVMENNDRVVELLLLTKPNERGLRVLKMIDFPSFKCICEFEMANATWLVSQPKCSINLYYLSGENMNAQGMPQEIEMKLVSETQPAERLKKLIYKGHMEEAEEFGKQFELSLQPIYEAKIKRILSDMSAMNEDNIELMEVSFQKLVDLLKLVENEEFFKNIRHLEIPSRRLLNMFLSEILKHVKEEDDTECIEEIKEQQLRLKTLALIDPYECNMDWQRFVHHPNIVKLCSSFMKTDILTACLIWKRHSASLIKQLDALNIRKLMNLIPANIEAFNLIQWLRHFVPTIVHAYPNLMPYIIDWSIAKARSLQFSKHWPEIGLEFSTKIAEIFDDIHFLYSDVRRQHERNLERLRELVNALQDLVVLKNSYNLVFTLDNYTKDSLDETAFGILQRVQITNLKNLVNNFLYPIYMERGQSPTNAICRYITFLVGTRQNQSSWLNRAVASIELLHSEDDRLECALNVLQAAPVPWPDTVAPILKFGNSTHTLAQKINTEYEVQIIKIMKVKYGWPADSTDSNMKLVFRILKAGLPDMVDDINDLTKAAPEIQGSAHFYCCYELARKGKLDTALRFFNNLKGDQKSECSEKMINILPEVLEDSGLDETSHKNLFEFFKLITPCSSKNYEIVQQIQNCHILRTTFNLNASTNDLRNHEILQDLLLKGINNFVSKLLKTETNITTVWLEICELSKVLNFEKIYGIFHLCKYIDDIYLSCALSYYSLALIDCTKSNADFFTDLAILLISQQIIFCQRKQEKDAGINEYTLAFPIANKLLIKALQYENTYQVEIIELIKWIQILNVLYDVNVLEDFYIDEKTVNDLAFKHLNDIAKPDRKSKKLENTRRNSVSVFDEVICNNEQQKDKISKDHSPAVQCVSLSLLLVILEIQPPFKTFSKLRSFIGNTDIIDVVRLRENFFHSLELLVKSKLHSSWYAVVQYLLQYQKKSDVIIIHVDFVTLQLRRVFRHLLSQKDPNFLELFAMLVANEQPPLMLDNLSYDLKSDIQKINLLILAEMYNIHVEDMVKVKSIRESRIKLFYFTELCKQDATLKLKSDIDIVSMGQLMKELRNNMLDVRLLERLSKDFGWDYQQVLVSQVIAVLNLQEPSFETKIDAFGKEELVMKSTVEEIKNLCQPYLNEIKNTELLASKLLQFMTEINFYFYEHYLCVIELLNYVDALPKEMQLWTCILLFLKHKMTSKRRNRPSQMEIDWWLRSHSEIGVLPKISKYRLPFMPIVQQPLKDILDNEVNVDNCESWFPLIKMHTVLQAGSSSHTDVVKMQDYFCMSAVKNSISEYKSNTESDVWHLQPTNNAFLQSILRLVEHVSNNSKVLLILYFVASHSPDGADQVEALYECYKFALNHDEELINQDKAVDTIQKIKRKYPILKTQHLLHIYGLIDDKLIQMVENPKELIHCLYYHDIILKPTKPDINKVCREIAELHNLDIDLMQFNLLQKWLTFAAISSEVTTLEETFYEDVNSSNHMTETKGAENVMRAHYILKSWETDKAMQFLVGHIFPADGSVNTSKQLQMYECFSQLNDGNSNYKDVLSQQKYIVIKCVHDLKQLGYNFSLEKFADYDKITILKKIWQGHANNPFAMEVIANICLGFEIYVPKIWNGVLKQMVKFNMIQQLNALVDALSCNSKIVNTDGLVKAWDCVLKIPFKKANKTRSFEQEELLMKTLFRIQGCPLVGDINLIEIAEDCVRIDRPHIASILIAFCSSTKQRNSIKTIICSRITANLRSDVLELEESGILPVITNFVLKELNI